MKNYLVFLLIFFLPISSYAGDKVRKAATIQSDKFTHMIPFSPLTVTMKDCKKLKDDPEIYTACVQQANRNKFGNTSSVSGSASGATSGTSMGAGM